MSRPLRVAVDVGGTFTDICVLDETEGTIEVAKVPSTVDPIEGVMRGIGQAGVDLSRVALFSHGTTVATNALITRRLPPAAMVTTRGFRDVIEIRRGTKEDLWDAYKDVAPPYIRRRDRLEVTERLDYSGEVLTPLDEAEAREVAERLRRRNVSTVAVCFVNAYTNPVHEQRMREILEEELPDVVVSTSSEVLPEIFEHERFSTTVANAVLAPLVSEYTRAMGERLAEGGYDGDLLLLHSGGLRDCRRCDRQQAYRDAVRLPECDRSRHGRHIDGHLARLRRRGPADQGVVRRVRLPDRLPLDRGSDDRRRWRLARLDRRSRCAPKRTAVCGSRPRPGVLRARQ
jgi:N-methylhydantoinase A/oxoprolinase/acetone carboxylase beta subunit